MRLLFTSFLFFFLTDCFYFQERLWEGWQGGQLGTLSAKYTRAVTIWFYAPWEETFNSDCWSGLETCWNSKVL